MTNLVHSKVNGPCFALRAEPSPKTILSIKNFAMLNIATFIVEQSVWGYEDRDTPWVCHYFDNWSNQLLPPSPVNQSSFLWGAIHQGCFLETVNRVGIIRLSASELLQNSDFVEDSGAVIDVDLSN